MCPETNLVWTRIHTPEMKSATEPEVLLARSGIMNGFLHAHECENMSEVEKQEANVST